MSDDFWVFGYGSLIWRPGFDYVERCPALLRGLHRSLCLKSYVHRGTPERPGLVAGLDKGGACRGMAFRISPRNAEETRTYLAEREQMNYCYIERTRKILIEGDCGMRTVSAMCFIVDTTHEQYCGALERKQKARLVQQGHGVSGSAVDYLNNLITSLEGLGIHDEGLLRLQHCVTGLGAASAIQVSPAPGPIA